jgi:DNA-binding MarR family transcriptional regulator
MHEPVPASEVAAVREASRRLVRELGFMRATLAGTGLPPSAVHALIEIGNQGATSATRLCELLMLDKSSTSRMLHKLVAAGEVAARVDERDGRALTLSLTAKGRHTLAEIDRFAQRQVAGALGRMAPDERQLARRGLAAYAGALQASRTGLPDPGKPSLTIRTGYLSGVVGRTVEMHARFYAAAAGFSPVFESKVAAGLAEFVPRLDRPPNQLWSAVRDGAILGTIAIDGEDLAPGVAHLR